MNANAKKKIKIDNNFPMTITGKKREEERGEPPKSSQSFPISDGYY